MADHDLRILVEAKREGAELDADAWQYGVAASLDPETDQAQLAALFMACYFRGMTVNEIVALTGAMVRSGESLEFTKFADAVDKHSSGGVGDTASLIVVPLLAHCGEHVAKLSGRALGHTGGTLDKLESIPGFQTELSPAEFENVIARAGCSIAAQSSQLVPADKILYALRDRTATVPCLGLIAASIVSKKIAGGARRFVFDVKVGNGAFMATLAEARELARVLVEVSHGFGRKAVAVISDMNQPLAPEIGNGAETVAAREFLAGRTRPPRLTALVRELATALLATRIGELDAAGIVDAALAASGPAERLERMIAEQGGDVGGFRAMQLIAPAPPFVASRSGFVGRVNASRLGNLVRQILSETGPLGGVRVAVEIGAFVEKGQPLGFVRGPARLNDEFRACFEIEDAAVSPPPVTYERVTAD